MKKILLVFLTAALFSLFTGGVGYTADNSVNQFVIVDWNVRGYPEKTFDLRELFSYFLKTEHPAILCVQEIANQDRVDTFIANEPGFSKAAFKDSPDG